LETTLEDATDVFSLNVDKYNVHCVTSQKSEYLIYIRRKSEITNIEVDGSQKGLIVKGV
jgi:hypothetical protein